MPAEGRLRKLLAAWFPPADRGVGVGWFLACVVLPPIAVLAPLLLFGLSMFWLMSRPADETLLRAEDQASFERLLTTLHQGMSRTELYSIGFNPMADARCAGTLPTPSRHEPHPAVESDFLGSEAGCERLRPGTRPAIGGAQKCGME